MHSTINCVSAIYSRLQFNSHHILNRITIRCSASRMFATDSMRSCSCAISKSIPWDVTICLENGITGDWTLACSSARGKRCDELRATISDTYRAVNMKGIPGVMVDPLARMLPYANELSPSVKVINIGTNDVCSRIVIPERLARQIVDVAVMFSRVSSVEIVVIMSIILLIVNRKVAAIVMHMPGVYTCKQRCIRLHPEIFFLNDGVHLMWVSLETSAG